MRTKGGSLPKQNFGLDEQRTRAKITTILGRTPTTRAQWQVFVNFLYGAYVQKEAKHKLTPTPTQAIAHTGYKWPDTDKSYSWRYNILVYTTPVNSAFRAIWLVPLSRDIKYYSPPGGFRRRKWRANPALS